MTKRCVGVLPEGTTLDDFTFRASHAALKETRTIRLGTRGGLYMHFGVSAPPCLLSQRASICYNALGVLEAVTVRSGRAHDTSMSPNLTPFSLENVAEWTITLLHKQSPRGPSLVSPLPHPFGSSAR
ncbi:hypothetical protein VTO73DRAFT_12150 [Trametes versicolor]